MCLTSQNDLVTTTSVATLTAKIAAALRTRHAGRSLLRGSAEDPPLPSEVCCLCPS